MANGLKTEKSRLKKFKPMSFEQMRCLAMLLWLIPCSNNRRVYRCRSSIDLPVIIICAALFAVHFSSLPEITTGWLSPTPWLILTVTVALTHRIAGSITLKYSTWWGISMTHRDCHSPCSSHGDFALGMSFTSEFSQWTEMQNSLSYFRTYLVGNIET
jgi:hypothetical protein